MKETANRQFIRELNEYLHDKKELNIHEQAQRDSSDKILSEPDSCTDLFDALASFRIKMNVFLGFSYIKKLIVVDTRQALDKVFKQANQALKNHQEE